MWPCAVRVYSNREGIVCWVLGWGKVAVSLEEVWCVGHFRFSSGYTIMFGVGW